MPSFDVSVEGVTYEVDAPDERTAWQWANYTHRQNKASAKPAAAGPQSGGYAALKAGIEGLRGAKSALSGKLGFTDMAQAEAEIAASKKRAAEIFKPTEEGWTEAPGTKFAELLGGSAPYMALPAAAALGAAALPLTGTAALAAGLGAAGLASAGQFTATNLVSQMEGEEGAVPKKSLEETDLGKAALAAIPQAALDTLSMRMIPGIGRMLGQAGVKVTAETAKDIAKQGLTKTLADYTLKTGKAAGVEGATEAAQQVFERLQAGLSITNEKARDEYFESFLGGAILGGTLAPAGRFIERGGEQREARGLLEKKAQEESKAAAAAAEAEKKTPAYALRLDTDYQAAVAKMRELQAAVPKKPAKDALPEEQMAYRAAVDARNAHLKEVLNPLTAEYAPRKAEIAQLNAQRDEQRQQAAELAALEVPQTEQKLPYYEAAQGTLPGLDAVENAPVSDEAALRSQLDRAEQTGDTEKVAQLQQQLEAFATPDYAQQIRNLTQQLEDLATQAQTTTDLATKLQLSKAYAQTDAALKAAKKAVKQTDQSAIDVLRKKMASAEAQGDLEAQGVLAQQLMDLGVSDLGGTDLTAQTELGLGKPQALSKLKVPTDLADYEAAQQAAQQKAAEEKTAREAKQRQQQELARTAYERSQQTADLYADLLPTIQRKAAERAAADAEAKAETERVQREEELTGKLVAATGAVQKQPAPQARMALPAGETTEGLYDQATELRAQLSFAQQTRNKALAARVQQQLQQIGASPEEKGSALDLGETARAAGVEGELTPEAMEQNRLTRLSQRQLMAYEQLVTHITRAREREQTAVDERTKAQYKYRAEQLKQAIIGFALQEINGRRQQYENTALTQKEAMRAVTGLSRPLNELIARGAQMFEEPVVKRAKYRGTRVLEGAQEFERPPAGKRTFSEASLRAASDTLREQFRQTVEAVSGKPPAPPPLPGKPPGKRPESLRKVVPEQRELFLTPSPAEEAVALVPDALLEKGANKAASADDARLLRQMQEIYTQLTPEQQSVVREQAQRAADGKPLDAVYEMRGLYDLQQREAATAAGQTTFLKPITLVTARRKIERLAQQAATLEKTFREKIEALIRTGVTRGIPELEQQIKAAGIKAAPKAKTQTPLAQAQAALDRALKQGKDLVDTAQKIKADQFREISKFSEYVYTPLLETQKKLSLEWDAAVAEFATLQSQYEYTRAEFDAGRAPKTNRAELATLTRLIPQTADRIVVVTKNLDEINRLVKLAESTIAAIRERQAADTIVGPLLKDAAKAKAKIDVAQTRLDDARDLEASIARGHAQLEAEAAAAGATLTRLLEQVESLPLTGVTRVFRDTSDPTVQALATKKRSAIAREEGTYAILEERIKTAEGDDKISLQRQLNDAEARLQTLHNELYDVYNNAPLKQVQGKTADIAASAERLEKARHAVHSAEIASFNAQHNTSRIKLPTHKVGAVVKEKGMIKQSGERAALPKTPANIDAIAATLQQLDAISQQLAYIKANPAQTNEGKAKQAKTKKEIAAKKQTLITKLKALRQEQAIVVRDERAIQKARNVSKGAIRRNRLEASDAQLFEDLAKATKTQEQTLLFERAENSFGEMSATEQAYVRRQANAIVGRRVSDYKGAELAELVAAAERRKLREDESDIALSRGATENPSTTADVRAELGKVFPDLGRVQIFDSVEALVAANPEYEGRIPDDARGFVDPDTNKAFLIAENIEQGQAMGVLLHEVGAHIGLKNMLGDAQYNALVKAVEAWEKRNDGSVESRVAKAARARVEAAETEPGHINDELLAYAVEEAVSAGVSPTTTKSPLGQWLARIAQAFRKALEKFGLPPKALDAQGLVDMAFGAAKMELRNPKISEFSKDSVFQTREEMQAGVRADMALRDAVQNYLLGSGSRPQAPQKIYRGVPKKQVRSETGKFSFVLDEDARVGGGTYVHYTPWFSTAKDAGKFRGAPGSVVVVAQDSAGKAQLYYRGGALAGDPLESTRIDSTKGMTWDQALAAAKQLMDTLYKEELAGYSETYGSLNEAQRVRAREDAASRASDAFVVATYETDANNLGGIWRKRDVPETLSRETPELRDVRTTPKQEILFSRNVPTAARVANALVGKEKGWVDYLRDNFLGMGFRAQFVDKLAPIEEALKKGGVSTIKALQAMYFLRMYDQRMHITSEAMTEGVSEVVEKTRKDGGTERIIQTKPGANIKKVVDILKQKDVIKAAGSADAANKLFTLYLAAIRAERVGAQTLNFGGKVTDADLKAARAEIEADPVLKKAFGEARDIYNQYNRNLLEFSVQTGALSRDVANKLLADNDYIPYYRIRDGVAQMVIGNETPIRIGNLKDSPHLKELVKGDEAIFDFLTSSVQNTAMLLDMAMKNLATKNAMFELRDVGLATISKVPKSGKTPEGAVTFKRDGEDYFAIVDTDTIGIDSDLLVKGMAGIPTMFPSIVRLLGIPARLLRRTVVASPVYMARQLFRDSLAASMTSGANITPVLGALRQIGKADVLRGRGITGGQVFTGMPEDVTRMLKEMQAGRVGVSSGLAWLEAKSAQMDSLTRRAQYQSYLDQGLSEMEATFMALESMNFSKRGLSPTMHMVSTVIPFFNAQIQGLDVLYKAFTGQMPMNERLDIRRKLVVRGALMFGMSLAYAAAMQDDKAYKNAKPEEKYGNWFVPMEQFGIKEPLRLPIPFELGYVFKSLPEALVNSFSNEKGGEEAMKAAKYFAGQMVPGLSNYFIPQAFKPGLEAILNKSIYTERDIESTKEQMVEPGARYRDNTTAAAREIGELLNISPVKMEYLIRGYTGSMGMALLAAVSAPFGNPEGPQAATKRITDIPLFGMMFQPTDASGIIDATYDRMKEVRMVKETYDDMIEKGRVADAQKYLSTRMNEMALVSVEGSFREYMGQIAEYERGIKASNMTPDEKREKIDAAKQMKIRLATAVRAVADKKEPQAAPA